MRPTDRCPYYAATLRPLHHSIVHAPMAAPVHKQGGRLFLQPLARLGPPGLRTMTGRRPWIQQTNQTSQLATPARLARAATRRKLLSIPAHVKSLPGPLHTVWTKMMEPNQLPTMTPRMISACIWAIFRASLPRRTPRTRRNIPPILGFIRTWQLRLHRRVSALPGKPWHRSMLPPHLCRLRLRRGQTQPSCCGSARETTPASPF